MGSRRVWGRPFEIDSQSQPVMMLLVLVGSRIQIACRLHSDDVDVDDVKF